MGLSLMRASWLLGLTAPACLWSLGIIKFVVRAAFPLSSDLLLVHGSILISLSRLSYSLIGRLQSKCGQNL